MLKQIKLLRSGIQTVKDDRINEERKHKCFLIKLRICTARRDYPTGNAADILKYQDRTKGNKSVSYTHLANALKNITIPKYEALTKDIQNALEEKEREEFTRLKVIKRMKQK